MLVLPLAEPPVAVTVKLDPPVVAPEPLVNVRVDDPLPGAAKVDGLKLAVIPEGNPEAEKATAELKPATAAVVSLRLPFTLELTVALVELALKENPGTFRVSGLV
jgi:hypothetical protein